MKHYLLSIVALVAMVLGFSERANAQFWVGGNVGYWYDTDAKESKFSISPEAGYDINSKWTVAGIVGLNYDGTRSEDKTVFSLEPYVKYKFYTVDRFTFYLNAGVGFGISGPDGLKVGVNPGVIYGFSDHFSVAANFGFAGYRDGFYSGKGGEGFGLGFDNALSFGLFYAF